MSAPDTSPLQRVVDAVKRNVAAHELIKRRDEDARSSALVALGMAMSPSDYHKRHDAYLECCRRAEKSASRAWMYREVENLVCGIAQGADLP